MPGMMARCELQRGYYMFSWGNHTRFCILAMRVQCVHHTCDISVWDESVSLCDIWMLSVPVLCLGDLSLVSSALVYWRLLYEHQAASTSCWTSDSRWYFTFVTNLLRTKYQKGRQWNYENMRRANAFLRTLRTTCFRDEWPYIKVIGEEENPCTVNAWYVNILIYNDISILPKGYYCPQTEGYHLYHYLRIRLPICKWENSRYTFSAGEVTKGNCHYIIQMKMWII